jgi:hypothetical protein
MVLFELNQHMVNKALEEINGEPEEAWRRLQEAKEPEARALWSVVHRQALHAQQPKRKGGCCG